MNTISANAQILADELIEKISPKGVKKLAVQLYEQLSSEEKPKKIIEEKTIPQSAIAEDNPFSPDNIKNNEAIAIEAHAASSSDEEIYFDQSEQHENEIQLITYTKKHLQSKFSRRSYRRDRQGKNLLSVILLVFICMSFTTSIVFANLAFLIPQTAKGFKAGKEAKTLTENIAQNQPKLAALVKRRKALNTNLISAQNSFTPATKIREDFGNFIAALEENPAIILSKQEISEAPSELPNITMIAVSLELETNFLEWLKIRKATINTLKGITITDETIIAPPGSANVKISVRMQKPAYIKG